MRLNVLLSAVLCVWMTGLPRECLAQGWANPTPTFKTPTATVTAAARKPAAGTINGYLGTAAFGKIAAGVNGAVALEGYGTTTVGANPLGGPQVWWVQGDIKPPAAGWTISPLVPPPATAARSPDHGLAWRRSGKQWASRGGDTVTP